MAVRAYYHTLFYFGKELFLAPPHCLDVTEREVLLPRVGMMEVQASWMALAAMDTRESLTIGIQPVAQNCFSLRHARNFRFAVLFVIVLIPLLLVAFSFFGIDKRHHLKITRFWNKIIFHNLGIGDRIKDRTLVDAVLGACSSAD